TTALMCTQARYTSGLSRAKAASVPRAGLPANQWHTRLGTVSGETVLVHNAGGGVGSFAVQIAHALGARVIGTASPAGHERLRSLGADAVDYGEGLAQRVRELAPQGVDVAADFAGGVLEGALAGLGDGGRPAA